MLALLAGCSVGPTAPIFGVWEGNPPGRAIQPSELVTLVLEGGPDATSGHYRISTIQQTDLQFGVGDGTRRWSGPWTSEPSMIQATPVRIIVLHNALADDISRYALAPNGVLVPVRPDNQPYSAQQTSLYGLRPVPRTSRNYGSL